MGRERDIYRYIIIYIYMNTHRHDIHFVVPEYMGKKWVSKTTVTTYLWVYWEWEIPKLTIYIKDWGL